MRTLHSALSALLVATTALAGIALAGCQSDDSSTPLPPAATDATTDHAASDGAATADGASPVESSTDAPAEGSADGGTGG